MRNTPPNQPPFSVHVARGTALRIPAGGLTISFGKGDALEMKATVEVLQVMTPHWLGIAIGHLDVAKQHHDSLLADGSSKDAIGTALEGEFLASMQAAVAAAVALDALYASVKEHVTLPPNMVSAWQKNRTTRHAQVAEVLQRGFKLKTHDAQSLRQAIKMIFETRDVAIHPPGKFSAPELHPELGSHLEWRFVRFRYEVARKIVGDSLHTINVLVSKDTSGLPEGLATLAQGIVANLRSLITTWSECHSSLADEG